MLPIAELRAPAEWLEQPADRAAFRRALLRWYRHSARPLPWRATSDPYRIWVSEVLLQQTRVEAGRPYYERFIRAFPDVHTLAAAPINRVLKLWEGLGYYSRARHLHRAAQIIVRQYAGRLPRSSRRWEELPGVGRYTAAAIASIAFGEPVPAVDGNVKRVVARLLRIEQPLGQARVEDTIWRAATRLLARTRPGTFNQAMMELGSCVCLPRQPRCSQCPVARWCAARAAGREADLPLRKARLPARRVEVAIVALERDGCYFLLRREQGLLAGMWGWPAAELTHGPLDSDTVRAVLTSALPEAVGANELRAIRYVGMVEHVFSHRRLVAHVYRCGLTNQDAVWRPARGRWIGKDSVRRYALARLDQKVLRLIQERTRTDQRNTGPKARVATPARMLRF